MTDGIIKGTGNSRYLKTVSNAPTQYPTYEAFIQALAAGTLPIDLNGINSTGWTQTGTPLNKANLLTDATAALAGLTATATPNTMFAKLANLIGSLDTEVGGKCEIETGFYTGTDEDTKTLTFSKQPKIVYIANMLRAANTVAPLYGGVPWLYGEELGHSVFVTGSTEGERVQLTWSGNSVTISRGRPGQIPSMMLNASSITYKYYAIL